MKNRHLILSGNCGLMPCPSLIRWEGAAYAYTVTTCLRPMLTQVRFAYLLITITFLGNRLQTSWCSATLKIACTVRAARRRPRHVGFGTQEIELDIMKQYQVCHASIDGHVISY